MLRQWFVILLDLGLPDIDGLSLIQQFRDFVDTPIIVISARTGLMDHL
jgi:two-component system KDP operon response regulator KdpE